jgi:aryl-alcohol dehydrogenase-like predicted oxidoreductase
MFLGIGGEGLSYFIDKPLELARFSKRARSLGFEFLDTSPAYHNAQVDRSLGRYVLPEVDFKVISKTGLQYCDLGRYRNRIGNKLGRLGSRLKVVSPGWDNGFNSEILSNEIKASLSRLNQQKLDAFLLHSVPSSQPIDNLIHALSKAKASGKIGSIGLSADQELEKDLSWADILQIPSSLRSSQMVRDFKGRIVFNGIFRENKENSYKVIEELMETYPEQSLVVGSKNLNHLEQLSEIIKGH